MPHSEELLAAARKQKEQYCGLLGHVVVAFERLDYLLRMYLRRQIDGSGLPSEDIADLRVRECVKHLRAVLNLRATLGGSSPEEVHTLNLMCDDLEDVIDRRNRLVHTYWYFDAIGGQVGKETLSRPFGLIYRPSKRNRSLIVDAHTFESVIEKCASMCAVLNSVSGLEPNMELEGVSLHTLYERKQRGLWIRRPLDARDSSGVVTSAPGAPSRESQRT